MRASLPPSGAAAPGFGTELRILRSESPAKTTKIRAASTGTACLAIWAIFADPFSCAGAAASSAFGSLWKAMAVSWNESLRVAPVSSKPTARLTTMPRSSICCGVRTASFPSLSVVDGSMMTATLRCLIVPLAICVVRTVLGTS